MKRKSIDNDPRLTHGLTRETWKATALRLQRERIHLSGVLHTANIALKEIRERSTDGVKDLCAGRATVFRWREYKKKTDGG